MRNWNCTISMTVKVTTDIQVEVLINNHCIDMQIGTTTGCLIMSQDTYSRRFCQTALKESIIKMKIFSGGVLYTLKQMECTVQHNWQQVCAIHHCSELWKQNNSDGEGPAKQDWKNIFSSNTLNLFLSKKFKWYDNTFEDNYNGITR